MANNLNLNIFSNFATTGTSLNLIKCIEAFDFGYNNIYILDEEGSYTGFAVTKKSFKKIWQSIDDSLVSVPGIDDQSNDQAMLQKILKIIQDNPSLNEIPLLKNNQVNSVVTPAMPKSAKGFEWKNISDVNLLPEVRNYKKIYLSSLENQDISNFYNCWSTRLPLIPLGNDNLMQAINDPDSLLIYSEDLFPECNKINIIKFWDKLVIYALNQMVNFCYISKNFASVKQNESNNLAFYIQKFDQGFHTVSIIDENNNFIECVMRSTFRDDFPKKNFRRWNNLYIDNLENEEQLKFEIAKWCFGTARRELPILINGKITASGRLGKVSSILQDKEEIFPPIYWDIINDESAKEFFGDKKKILISSIYGNLEGFYERFKNMLDITIFDDKILEKYLAGEFDMLIYGAEVWSETPTMKYLAKDIYTFMLNIQVRRYLESKNISYYVVGYKGTPIVNINQKIEYIETKVKSKTIFGGIYDDYNIFADAHNEDIWNLTGGIRRTVGNPKKFERTIHIFGPCLATGWFSKDSATIESILQRKINQNNISCKVVNYGYRAALTSRDINLFYILMDKNFHEGDIVILLGILEKNIPQNENNNHFYIEDIFNRFEIRDRKIFADQYLFHVNSEGDEVIAEFLWEKLYDKLSEKLDQPQNLVRSFFDNIAPPPPPLFKYESSTEKLSYFA
ncbi:MAG: hypothetical protein IJ728_13300 [Selenomonadaceae bacterium]|nr:hypothetical protein [Selenomonadaceae bacterium]